MTDQGPGGLTAKDLEILRAQQMVIVEKQGEHGARISAVEDAQHGIKDDLREIRDLIRQQARPAPTDPNMGQLALSLHNVADAMKRSVEAQNAPARRSFEPPTQFSTYLMIAGAIFVLGGMTFGGLPFLKAFGAQ